MNKEFLDKVDKIIETTKAKLLSSDIVYKDNFLNLVKEKYELPNGKIITRDRIIKNNNKEAVIIISETTCNNYLVVIQNRINNITSVEFPSGYIEEGESITDAAERELLEETGYISNNITTIDSFNAQLGIDPSIIHVVVAKECIKVSNQDLGDSEYINYMEVSFDELKELIDNNIINGSFNKLAFYKLKDMLNEKELVLKYKNS